MTKRLRFLVIGLVALWAVAISAQPPGGQGRGGFVAYPPRPVDAAAVARGKVLYSLHCTFCHGSDAHGGDGGGPSLLRSLPSSTIRRASSSDRSSRTELERCRSLRCRTPQIADVAEFLHSFPISSRTPPSTINILVGNPSAGATYVKERCASCHTVDKLKAFAMKLTDNKTLQQMWLMPGSGGGGGGRGGTAPIPAPPITVTVTMPGGERLDGTLVRMDDFSVSLRQADGAYRSIRTFGTTAKVDVHDPLASHKDMLPTYRDSDIHDVTAYLASLRDR